MESRKITAEEAAKLKLTTFGKKHAVRVLLESLEPGEIAHISRADFRWKHYTPSIFLKELKERKKRKFIIMKEVNHAGWVVTRLK